MGDEFTVDVAQLRTHAGNLDALKDRFAAVKSASTHIAQDDQAYGLLCAWISAVLEGRHQRQDQLVAFVEENLGLAAQSLRDSADDYEEMDATAADTMDRIGGDLQAPR
jgi:hypothetical protein